jgi:hypothetical protein
MLNSIRKINTCIGIDPGRHTGVAVWNRKDRCFGVIKEMTFWETCDLLKMTNPETTRVFIEDPNLVPNLFQRSHVTALNAKLKNAQDVGRVKEQAWLLLQLCQKLGLEYYPVKPVQAKKDAHAFAKITHDTRRLNQHCRDAAMLVWGM